jgi:hypothetical protein
MWAAHSTQPQARRHGPGQGHPDPLAPHLYPEFVRWHMAEVHVALLDEMAVHVAAVVASPGLPLRHGPLLEAAGRHDRLERAARAEPGQPQGDDVHGRPQAIEGGAQGRRNSPATCGAAIARLLLAMARAVPLSHLPSGGSVRVVPELTPRVHGGLPPEAVERLYLEGWTLDPGIASCASPHHG